MRILSVRHKRDDVDEAVEDEVVDEIAVFVLDQNGEEGIANVLQKLDDLLALDLHQLLEDFLQVARVFPPIEHVENVDVLRQFRGAEQRGNCQVVPVGNCQIRRHLHPVVVQIRGQSRFDRRQSGSFEIGLDGVG